MTKPFFKDEKEVKAFEDLMTNTFMKVYRKVMKPDIDSFLEKKCEQVNENTDKIDKVFGWLTVIKIKRVYIPVSLILLTGISIAALYLAIIK